MSNIEYIIHTRTQNLSFIRCFRYLRDKGVENNKFFLRLYDKDLENVNPHSKKLTAIEKTKIIAECTKNPYYFLREVCLISIPGGKAKFDMHPGNLAITWSLLNSLDILAMLPRQQYKTVTVAAILAYFFFFRTKNSHAIFGNKQLKDSRNNLARFKAIVENFPSYILDSVIDVKADTDNVDSVIYTNTKNKITVIGNPNNEPSADNAGRGASVPFLWLDEFAFISFNDTLLHAASPAYRTVADLAEREGFPHSKIITTTPNNIDTPNGKVCKEMMNNACMFFEQMYDWSREKVLGYIHTNSANSFLYIKYTWQQLGKNEKWYETNCRDLSWNWLKIRREVDLEWTKSSDNSIFKEEELDILYNHIIHETNNLVIEVEKENKGSIVTTKIPYNLTIIGKELKEDYPYFIGVDVGGGLGKDYTAIIFTDPHDKYKERAVFKNNTISLNMLKYLLLSISLKFKYATFFIENNNYGRGVIEELLEYPRIAKRIYYNYRIADKDKTKPNPSKVTKSIEYGINTNTASRELMIDILREAVLDNPESITSKDLYEDIKGLEYNSRGKVEHGVGMHDDCLFAKLMVLYAVRYGNNIAKFFRDADTVRNIQRRTASLTKNNVFNKVVNDPATDLGTTIDINIIVKRLQMGESIEEIKDSLQPKQKGKDVNKLLVKSLSKYNNPIIR